MLYTNTVEVYHSDLLLLYRFFTGVAVHMNVHLAIHQATAT